MKRLLRGVSVLAAATAMALAPAAAQSLASNEQFIVKVGISAPTKDNVRSADTTWWMGGLEYQFGDPDAVSVNSMELDYTAGSGRHTPALEQEIRERYRTISLMFNHKVRRIRTDRFTPGNVLFYGAGVGADVVRVQVDDPNPGGEGSIRETGTLAAANVFVGYEFASNLQLEARYHLSLGDVADRKMNSFQLLAGFKF